MYDVIDFWLRVVFWNSHPDNSELIISVCIAIVTGFGTVLAIVNHKFTYHTTSEAKLGLGLVLGLLAAAFGPMLFTAAAVVGLLGILWAAFARFVVHPVSDLLEDKDEDDDTSDVDQLPKAKVIKR